MKQFKTVKALAVALAVMVGFLATTHEAKAGVLTLTFAEVNGADYDIGSPFPLPAVEVQTDLFTIPAGNVIAFATLSGVFGSNSIYLGSTAEHDLRINGTQVGSTYDVIPDPYLNTVPFSFNVPISLLAGGSADLSYVQESEYIVRLSETTLTITYVPEPASFTLLGASLLAVGIASKLRRRGK